MLLEEGKMLEGNRGSREDLALELAAKYICNLLNGLCPQVVAGYPCPTTCTLETLPWQCWSAYFQSEAAARRKKATKEEPVAKAA